MTIWNFQKKVARRLFRLNILNVYIGIRLQKRGGFWGGVGAQAVGWGLINIAIAVLGNRFASRRRSSLDDPTRSDVVRKERHSLRRIFLINIPLNFAYMWSGKQLAEKYGNKDSVVRGHGWGIMLQGLILFFFDTFHFLSIPSKRARQ